MKDRRMMGRQGRMGGGRKGREMIGKERNVGVGNKLGGRGGGEVLDVQRRGGEEE